MKTWDQFILRKWRICSKGQSILRSRLWIRLRKKSHRWNHQLEVKEPRQHRIKASRRVVTKMMRTKSYKILCLQLSFLKSQMWNGPMLPVLRVPRRASKKPSLCQSSSHNFSKAQESHGQVFYCMAHPVLVRVFWLKHARLSVTQPSSPFLHLIWCPNGKENLKNLSNSFSS